MSYGVEPTLNNVLKFTSVLSPLLIIFFLVTLSLFNQDIKGIVYLAGIFFALVINIFISGQIKNKTPRDASIICNVFNYPNSDYNIPSISSVMIAFSIAYLLLPMRYNNNMNYFVLVALCSLFGIDAYTKTANLCSPNSGVVLGGLVGFMLGSLWFAIFHTAGYDSLLYFETYSSNRVFCEKPSKQQFKCKVYKNGQLLKTL